MTTRKKKTPAEITGAAAARDAAKLLRDADALCARIKRVAASALAQRPDKPPG